MTLYILLAIFGLCSWILGFIAGHHHGKTALVRKARAAMSQWKAQKRALRFQNRYSNRS